MIIKRFYFLFFPVFFTCYSTAFSQVMPREPYPVSDTAIQTAAKTHHDHYLKLPALILPGTLVIYGGLKPFIPAIPDLDNRIMADVQKNHPDLHTNAADYMMWVPAASIYVMDALHVKTAHTFREHLILDAGSVLITGGIGYGMRIISRQIKVYNTKDTKFPSGHTANAFRGAEIVHQELKERSPILSYSGYVVATGVGLLRIYDKDHLLSEVLTGAGLGIISTKLTYWLFDKIKRRE